MAAAGLIGLDWGTTSARSYRLDEQGRILDQRSLPLGISSIQDGRFAEAFQELVAGWDDRLPCLASGMIGSRQGWLEAPYVECPASFNRLAGGIVRVDRLCIVPGLITRDVRGVPDVLRGEETQILGAVSTDEPRVIAILPGTHSKWAIVERGVVVGFATFMTGELYSVLLAHSILGRMATTPEDNANEAFGRGVQHGLAAGGLTHDLFAVRTLGLTGKLMPHETAPFLSGLLIGRELQDGRQWLAARIGGDLATLPVRLIGAGSLCVHYQQALQLGGIRPEDGPADSSARGLWRIAQQANLVSA